MGFKTFEDIEAWQGARVLAQKLRIPCQRAAESHDYGWADQLGRAAVSVMANIAEGNDAQSNPVFIQFLGYAKRSGAEVRSHLYIGLDRGYLSKEEFDECVVLALRVTKQLSKLIQYLQKHRDSIHSSVEMDSPSTFKP